MKQIERINKLIDGKLRQENRNKKFNRSHINAT